jgi:hypothetical protein
MVYQEFNTNVINQKKSTKFYGHFQLKSIEILSLQEGNNNLYPRISKKLI